ncbi:MAG: hypothetical protein ACM31J_07660 [Nitrososphaerales archaeon]
MDLNILPRGCLGSLYNNNKNKNSKEYSTKTRLSFHKYKIKKKKTNKPNQKYMVLEEKVDSIRETWTKLYFNKILRRFSSEDLWKMQT